MKNDINPRLRISFNMHIKGTPFIPQRGILISENATPSQYLSASYLKSYIDYYINLFSELKIPTNEYIEIGINIGPNYYNYPSLQDSLWTRIGLSRSRTMSHHREKQITIWSEWDPESKKTRHIKQTAKGIEELQESTPFITQRPQKKKFYGERFMLESGIKGSTEYKRILFPSIAQPKTKDEVVNLLGLPDSTTSYYPCCNIGSYTYWYYFNQYISRIAFYRDETLHSMEGKIREKYIHPKAD